MVWSFIWINLNYHHTRMLYVNFGLNWPYGNEEKDFWMSMNIFWLLIDLVLLLNKLEYPSLKNALCQVWMKLAQLFGRTWFLNVLGIISLICYNLPLEKSLDQTGIPITQRLLSMCQVWLKVAQWFWRRIQVWTVYNDKDKANDN